LAGLESAFRSRDGGVRAFCNNAMPVEDERAGREFAHYPHATMFPGKYRDVIQRSALELENAALSHAAARYAATARVYDAMKPLFEKALADPLVTAWVCSNDDAAIMALDFLAKKRCPVPGRISVMGFDDSRQAVEARLTSYNANADRLPQAMMTHILQFRRRPFDRDIYVRMPGTIMERATTGPAPAAAGPARFPPRHRAQETDGRPRLGGIAGCRLLPHLPGRLG